MKEVQSSPYRWVILLLAGFTSFPMLAGMTSFPIAAPEIGKYTAEQIASADGFFGYYWGIWFGFGLASFVIGSVGLKRTLMVGLLCAAIPQLLIPFCPGSMLKTLRFIQGLCSMNIPVLFAFCGGCGWFQAKEQSIATGIFLGMINCGSPFGDYVAKHVLHGRATFIGLGLFALALLAVCSVFMKVNTAALEAAAASESGNAAGPPEKKSVLAYKATWILALLFIPMCTPYWGIPVVWPQYAGFLGFDAGAMSTVQLWVGLVGFMAVLGGVVSDGMLRKNGQVIPARIGCIRWFMLASFAGMVITYPATSLVPLILTMIITGLCYAGIAIFWALPPLVFPPDPDLNGKAASLLTFVGNSPIVFVGPFFGWLSQKLGGWPPVFVVSGVCAAVVLVPALIMLKAEIQKKLG